MEDKKTLSSQKEKIIDKIKSKVENKIIETEKNKNKVQNNIEDFIEEKNKNENKKNELGLYGIKETFHKEISVSKTKFHKGSLRSGQKLEFEGSLVIIGDVNSGSEVIAEDNIVVLGNLRGLAHCGAKGNKDAFIAAEKILSPQLRIADKIAELERKNLNNDNIKTFACLNEKEEVAVV